MKYVPKVSVTFRMPTGAVVGGRYPLELSLKDAARRAWPGLPAEIRVLHKGQELSLSSSLGCLGIHNDTELEVLA